MTNLNVIQFVNKKKTKIQKIIGNGYISTFSNIYDMNKMKNAFHKYTDILTKHHRNLETIEQIEIASAVSEYVSKKHLRR